MMEETAAAPPTPPATEEPESESQAEPDTSPEPVAQESHQRRQGARYTAILALAALGVVYGDIGTSPLYAVRESLHPGHGVLVSPENVTGVISLIFWSMVMVICIKYLFMVLRADHHGEGGILALTALVGGTSVGGTRKGLLLVTLGLFGTSLLFGDGMITPAISVLSAVEGLEYILPQSKPHILQCTVLILAALFAVQSRGTATVGKIFGPLVLVWFATLTALGLYELVQAPAILAALSPHHGLTFFLRNGWPGFLVLGSVFLVVTGGEALYADMGHFGRKPIQLAWFFVAFPALMINYLGQGALLLRQPETISNPFFLMGPRWALSWVVIIATLATVIASQALISGVFSLSMQAVQLGYLPRLEILHTSARERGQVYVPGLNWLLMFCCIGLVMGFRSSTNLAAAYGVAVTATMLITTVLFFCLLIYGWNWRPLLAAAVCGLFLLIELVFFAANVVKIPEGGWFPLLTGWGIFILMSTWKKGRSLLYQLLQNRTVPLQKLLERIQTEPVNRIPGTAIFMYGNRTGTPPALLANLDHNQILHERVVLVAVETADVPTVPTEEKVEVSPIAEGFFRIVVRFGFLEKPELPPLLHGLDLNGSPLRVHESTFFLGRETVIPRKERFSGMGHWREKLFALMTRNALDATSFFALPHDRVVELGTQLEI